MVSVVVLRISYYMAALVKRLRTALHLQLIIQAMALALLVTLFARRVLLFQGGVTTQQTHLF